MNFLDSVLARNEHYAADRHSPDLKMLPSSGTVIVGCVDPRVDPAEVLDLAPGEAAVIRNVGGRVNEPLLETLSLLQAVARGAGKERAIQHLILLHHTDCGIVGCQRHAPELLASHLDVSVHDLDQLAIADPYGAVAMDIEQLRDYPQLPDWLVLTGLVYDVKTGRVQVAVPSAPVR